MSAKHTPGPWRVEENTTLVWGHCNPDDGSTYGMGYPVAEARLRLGFGPNHQRPFDANAALANARLIAAAPDLLEAMDPQGLEFAADCLERLERAPRVVERLRNMAANQRAAIARATGEQG